MMLDVSWPYPFRQNISPECHFIYGKRFTFGSCSRKYTHTAKFPSSHILGATHPSHMKKKQPEYASMAFKYFLSIVKCDAFTVECTQRIKTLYREIDHIHTLTHTAYSSASSIIIVSSRFKFEIFRTCMRTSH